MSTKSILTVLFLGLLFGTEVFASVEAEPQSEVVTEDGVTLRFGGTERPDVLVRTIYTGETVVVTPRKCEYVRLSPLYNRETCHTAEVWRATETGLVHGLPQLEPGQKEKLRIEMVAMMVWIVLMMVAIVLMWYRMTSVAFVVTIFTVIAFVVTAFVTVAFLVSAAALVTTAAFFPDNEEKNNPRKFYALAGSYLALMAFAVFLIW